MTASRSTRREIALSRGRTWVVFLGTLLSVVLVLVAAAPTLLSTSPGRNAVVALANARIQGSVSLDALSLSWFGEQRLRGLTLAAPNGKRVLRLETLTTGLSLWRALRRRIALAETQLHGLDVALEVNEAGDDNLRAALAPTEPPEPGEDEALIIPVTGRMQLTDAHVSITTPNGERAELRRMRGRLAIAREDRALGFELHAATRQSEVDGSLDVTGEARDWLTRAGTLTPQRAALTLDADVDNFPLLTVDGLLGLDGMISAALGERLSAQLTLRDSAMSLVADAPYAEAHVRGTFGDQGIAGGRLTLIEPARIHWTVRPQLVTTLTRRDGAPGLAEPVPLVLTVDELAAPLAADRLGAAALTARIAAEAPVRLTGLDGGPVSVQNIETRVASERLAEAVRTRVNADVASRDGTGKITLDGAITDLLDDRGRVAIANMRVDADASVRNVPSVLLDRVLGLDGLLGTALGPRLSVNASAHTSDTGRVEVTSAINSEHLTSERVRLSIANDVTLEAPAALRYQLTQQTLARFLADSDVALAAPAAFTLTLEQFRAPLDTPAAKGFASAAALAASLAADTVRVTTANGTTTRLEDLALTLSGAPLTDIAINGHAQLAQSAEGVLARMSASPLAVRLNGETGLDDTGALEDVVAQLELDGGELQGTLPARFEVASGMLALTEPAEFRMPLTPELFAALLPASMDDQLAAKSAAALTVEQLTVGLASLSLTSTHVEGAGRIERLELKPDTGAGLIAEGTELAFSLAGDAGTARMSANARIRQGDNEPGRVQAQARLSELGNQRAPELDLDLQADGLPAPVIALASGQPAVSPLLGSPLDAEAELAMTWAPNPTGTARLQGTAKNLDLAMQLEVGDALTLSEPAALELTLTPSAYAALAERGGGSAPPLALTEPATLSTTLDTFELPLGDGQAGLPAVALSLSAPRVTLAHRETGERFRVEQLHGTLRALEPTERVDLAFDGRVQSGTAEPGNLALDAKLHQALSAAGTIAYERLGLDLEGEIERLPTAIVDQTLGLDGRVTATLGPRVAVTVDGRLREGSGPLDLDLEAPYARADIAAQWENGVMSLREPLVAEVAPRPEFGRAVLARVHPIFASLYGGDSPLRLTIPAQGVRIPIRDYALDSVEIPEMRVELGTLTLARGPLLESLMELAARIGDFEPTSGRYSAHLTPAALRLQNGSLEYLKRVDLLLDERLHLATWGNVNLTAGRVDLTLALMPLALKQLFDIEVEGDRALRLPVTGSLTSPRIDLGRASAELARLRMQSGNRDGAGGLLGAVAGAISGAALEQLPEPSVTPLPWVERRQRAQAPAPEGEADGNEADADPGKPQSSPR